MSQNWVLFRNGFFRLKFSFRKSVNSALITGIGGCPVFSVRYESVWYKACVRKLYIPTLLFAMPFTDTEIGHS